WIRRRRPRFAHFSRAFPPIIVTAMIEEGIAAFPRYGQQYTDLGTPALMVSGADLSAMLFHQLFNDSKAEPGAFGLAGDVGIECLIDDVLEKARTIILHANLHRLDPSFVH